MKAAPLFPSVWPSPEPFRLAGAAVRQSEGGTLARCVCSALVKEEQLLSVAKEGTEKLYNALGTGNGLSPNLLLIHCPSHSEAKYGVRERKKKNLWTIGTKLSGVTRSGGLNCRWLEVFCCFPVVGPRRWRRLSPRSGVPVRPAPCKT